MRRNTILKHGCFHIGLESNSLQATTGQNLVVPLNRSTTITLLLTTSDRSSETELAVTTRAIAYEHPKIEIAW